MNVEVHGVVICVCACAYIDSDCWQVRMEEEGLVGSTYEGLALTVTPEGRCFDEEAHLLLSLLLTLVSLNLKANRVL